MRPESTQGITRREAMKRGLLGAAGLALTDTLGRELQAAPKVLPAKAKSVIQIWMWGGPSHLDTFDPKPKLRELHKTESKNDRGLAAGSFHDFERCGIE